MAAVRTDGEWEAWLSFFIRGIAKQAEESVTRTLALDDLRRRYEDEYGGVSYTKNKLFDHPYLTTKIVQNLFDVEQSTAYRANRALEEDGILEQPPQTY